jgi:hypothetical protein
MVLLACEPFASVPGPSHRFKGKATSFLRIGLPLVIAMIGAASAFAAGILLTHGVWRVFVVALLAIAAGIVFCFRRTISPRLSVLWGKIKASEKGATAL